MSSGQISLNVNLISFDNVSEIWEKEMYRIAENSSLTD